MIETLTDAPGHLFESTKLADTHYDDRPEIDLDEEATAMWLMALMLDWTWEGFALVEGCKDVVTLGDGFLKFETEDLGRLAAAKVLVDRWGLKWRTDFPWTSAPGSQLQ